MGEKIRTLSRGEVLGHDLEIEINHPMEDGQEEQIHIQSPKFRFEMSKSQFIKYGLKVLLAQKQIKITKRI